MEVTHSGADRACKQGLCHEERPQACEDRMSGEPRGHGLVLEDPSGDTAYVCLWDTHLVNGWVWFESF